MRAPLGEVQEWVLENVRVRPGFREVVELARERGWRFVIVSSGFRELIEPVLEREGLAGVELLSNTVDPDPDGWKVQFRVSETCDVCGQPCKRVDRRGARGRHRARLRGRRLLGPLCRRVGRPRLRAPRPGELPRGARRPLRARSRTSIPSLAVSLPEPFDFGLSTERYRAFGPDLANLWHEDGLHRVLRRARGADRARPGRRQRRAAAAPSWPARAPLPRRALRPRRLRRFRRERPGARPRSSRRCAASGRRSSRTRSRRWSPRSRPSRSRSERRSSIRNRLIEAFGERHERRVRLPGPGTAGRSPGPRSSWPSASRGRKADYVVGLAQRRPRPRRASRCFPTTR